MFAKDLCRSPSIPAAQPSLASESSESEAWSTSCFVRFATPVRSVQPEDSPEVHVASARVYRPGRRDQSTKSGMEAKDQCCLFIPKKTLLNLLSSETHFQSVLWNSESTCAKNLSRA